MPAAPLPCGLHPLRELRAFTNGVRGAGSEGQCNVRARKLRKALSSTSVAVDTVGHHSAVTADACGL